MTFLSQIEKSGSLKLKTIEHRSMMNVLFVSLLLACIGQFGMGQTDKTVIGVVANDPDLDDLQMAVRAAGLVKDLYQLDPVSVFAPVNAAFGSVDAKFLDPSWILHLENILLFHTGLGDLTSESFADDEELIMLNEEMLTLGITGTEVTLNGAFGSVNVIATDLDAKNGVVHKIDQVLLPDFVRTTIVDILDADMSSRFSTLIELVVAAGLDETLATIDMTLLAPSNEAFDALDPVLLEEILNDVGKLTQVLLYHVIPGPEIYPSSALEQFDQLETTEGSDVFVNILPSSGRVFFNFAEVFLTDALAVNGIVHGIDQVLIPPSVQFPDCAGLDDIQYKICIYRSRKSNGD